MKVNHLMRLTFGISLLIGLLVGCQTIGTYKDVSVDHAKQMIDDGEVIVVDVRTDSEYAAGHIPNSILVPVQELSERLDELDPSASYLIVCRSGNRSAQASELLIEKGFKNIYNMKGGMNEWTYDVE